jgi:hypothetical protein
MRERWVHSIVAERVLHGRGPTWHGAESEHAGWAYYKHLGTSNISHILSVESITFSCPN